MANRCNHCSETYSMPALLQPIHKSEGGVHQYCRACFEDVANLIIRSKDNALLVKCVSCEKYVRVESQHKDRITSLFERQIRFSRQDAAEIERMPINADLQLSH